MERQKKWSSSQIIHERFVKSVNNRCRLSQRNDFECINRLFPVIFDSEHQLLYENVKKKPKMDSEEQQRRARKNCGKLYQKLLNDYDLIIDDENYLKIMPLETDTSIQLIHLLLFQTFDFNKRLNSNQR